MKSIRFINRLIKSLIGYSANIKNTPFTDLTPTDKADSDGSYKKALSYALETSHIKNIALTGPYGSGKSSIIRTFEKNADYSFLNISLSSFKEDNNSTDPTLIERSILQQMLYGADANRLPYSRFKRISTPEQPLIKAMLFTSWPLVAIIVYHKFKSLPYIEAYSLEWLVSVFLISFFISIPVIIVSDIYKSSFGISLKKLSLKNAEIEISETSDNSILNRHLDEIIYFFQVTNYDVVAIEDLDRFGNPEIFVKLREINKLINDNMKSREIKFLYALKDDMFAHKDRTKFFDFIIPVVPIINSYNSLDKMLEHLTKHGFEKKIDTQFIREVSLYINDLRLIHNIFNEFIIYHNILKSDNLNTTKLLAMMIYKNVYPNDFENLHHDNGALFWICKKKPDYMLKLQEKLKTTIDRLKTLIESSNNENAKNISELISIYLAHIIMSTNQSAIGIVINNQHIGFSQLTTFDKFQPLLTENNIQLTNNLHNHPSYRFSTNKSFSIIEKEVSKDETFLSRKENVENKSSHKRILLQHKIKLAEKEIADISNLQLFQLLQDSDIELKELRNKHKISDGNLFVYLVKNGYLDDNYNLYISNFHEGRLTKNDRDFLLCIRNFIQPGPNQKIDSPREVCENMREEDFSQKYVLNVSLIDYLFEKKDTSSKHIKSAMRYISQSFEQSEEFFTAYFVSGKQLDKFIQYLSQEWPRFAAVAIPSKLSAEIISYIIRFVDPKYVSDKMNANGSLTSYLSENGHLVFASGFQPPDDYTSLKMLNVRFNDLVILKNNKNLIEFSHKESLYIITPKNVNYIIQTYADSNNFDKINQENSNYTSIINNGSEYLKEYIEKNLSDYIKEVFLALPENTDEDESAIKRIINHADIDIELKKDIISKQNYVFDTLAEVENSLWSHLLLQEKVIISWKNISDYFGYKDNDKSVISNILGRQHIINYLSGIKIPTEELGPENAKSLSRFIIHNNEISDSDYCKLINSIPYWYSYFPEKITKEKTKCLAQGKTVRLTEQTFSQMTNDDQITAILICKNFNEYVNQKNKYPIDDNIRELLLSSDLSNVNKIIICLDVTPDGAKKSKTLSSKIANLIISVEVDCSIIDDSILSSAIINATSLSESIKLLFKCIPNWDEAKTMNILAKLPDPINEISSYGKRPKLTNNETNLAFARLLEKKRFISSIKADLRTIKINTFKSKDHSE